MRHKPPIRKDENPLSGATWLYSYADLMTQLLLFSILMLTVLGIKAALPEANAEEPENLSTAGDDLEQALRDAELSGVVIDRASDRLIIRMTSVLFERGQDRLTGTAEGVLDEVARFLAAVPNRVRVEGHTDNVPIHTAKFPSNWELSTARAISVVRYLEGKGIVRTRLSVAGYGQFHGIVANDTADNRALNRRVEIVILGKAAAQ